MDHPFAVRLERGGSLRYAQGLNMNRNRIVRVWQDVRGSYWFIPAAMSLGAFALSYLVPYLDDVVQGQGGDVPWWIYGGGVTGARIVLSSIAGSMITVASLTFSITLVALSSAAQQYGPRLLNNYMRDSGYQVVLGAFLAAFLYSILVLRQISDDENGLVLPRLAVSVSVFLAIAVVALLIYFFHHAAASLKAENAINRVADELLAAIDKAAKPQKETAGDAPQERLGLGGDPEEVLRGDAALIPAPESGYLRGVDEERLARIAVEADVAVRSERRVGEFIIRGLSMAEVWPPEKVTEKVAEDISEAFEMGPYSQAPGDIEAAANELVEIAVRALSPSLNDPNTAIACIDQLARGMERMAQTESAAGVARYVVDGRLRVAVPRLRFVDLVDLSFDRIRHHARGMPSVNLRLLMTIGALISRVRDDASKAALLRQAEMVDRAAEAIPEPQDRIKITRLYVEIRDSLAAGSTSPT